MIPIRTSLRPRRTPYVNYALIAVNIVIFFFSFIFTIKTQNEDIQDFLEPFRLFIDQSMLHPKNPQLWQFVSYAFLHGGFLHIFGNMFFLYIFGANVNDKLGNFGYLCFYLAGAVFSGLGHAITDTNSVLGASGAVAAVTGAYLVLFPRTLITVVYFFFFIGTIELPAIYFILFKLIILDNIIIANTANVAYNAHLAGYAFGIASILIMLSVGLIESSHFDLWAMIRQWNRRRKYRDTVSSGYDPYKGYAKPVAAKQVKRSPAEIEREETTRRLRIEINQRINQRNLAAAAETYLKLVEIDPNQVPPQQYLLDIANQFASEGRYSESAQAYEKFLQKYSDYEHIEQVQLMLGLLYSRYLEQPEAAIKYLSKASEQLRDEGQAEMCRAELKKLQN